MPFDFDRIFADAIGLQDSTWVLHSVVPTPVAPPVIPSMLIRNRAGITLFNAPPSELAGKNLSGALLHYAYLPRVNFTGCNLTNANFNQAKLQNAKFVRADLTGATFAGADLRDADFTGAKSVHTLPGWRLVEGILEKKPAGECSMCPRTEADCEIRQCGQCEDCCSHRQCDSCSDCHDDVCRHCDACSDCCECSLCSGCGNLAGCSDCDLCGDCCSCSYVDDDGDDEAPAGKPWTFAPGSKFKCKRTIGVEWEFNALIDLHAWRTKWRGGVHSDGSCGWEAVTAPMAGDHIKNCLTDLATTFKEKGAEADQRCGIHVHVDARDLQWADMYRLLWVYGKVEPLMYLLAGQHRSKVDRDRTSYCKPVGKDFLTGLSEVDRKGAILSVALGRGGGTPEAARKALRQSRIGKKDSGRYRGLNIIPWLAGRAYKEKKIVKDRKTGKRSVSFAPKSDSTVEFRMHRNTLMAERVVGWAQLCAKLVDWCANATDKEAQNLPKSALRALCEVIAPECAPWILHRVKEWRKATKVAPMSKKRRIPRRISLSEKGYTLKVAS